MKPLAPVSGLSAPLALGLAALPFWIDAPVWGGFGSVVAVGWAYAVWRREVDRRAPLPALPGESFAPLDVSIAWRTPEGESPAFRRGWRALLTEYDVWLSSPSAGEARGPLALAWLLGGDRDYVRIPRLDVVACDLATESEVRVRFLDADGRAQEARLTHVPRAVELARALGYSEGSESRV